MKIRALRTGIFKEKESLIDFIREYIRHLPEKSILVVTSKIVALAEGRTLAIKNKKTKELAIKSESDWALRTKFTWLTIKDGLVMSSAGIDESNAGGKLILLPKNSFRAASEIRTKLQRLYKIKKLGVLITDSRLMPLRAGIVGVALGYAGFKGIRDYRGKPDLFGRKLKLTRVDVADSLATSAVVVMGEGKERQPLAIIENAPVEFTDRINGRELQIDIKEDIYQPLFADIKKVKFKNKK
jgi:coenzyme F420-0:L-glutamate ligase